MPNKNVEPKEHWKPASTGNFMKCMCGQTAVPNGLDVLKGYSFFKRILFKVDIV